MQKTYNWGILGLGNIAHKFAEALNATENAVLFAVGSRELDKANGFADKFGARRWYGSYEQLMQDPEVEIVYISTPHHLHYELTLKCLEHGKHVLCEKPAAVNFKQFREARDLAREKNLFYMDALWTRFLPNTLRAMEWIEKGRIGDIRMLQADFGFKAEYNPVGRLFNPKLAGGALLDIGIYPVFLSLLFLGYPDEINIISQKADTGVDISNGITFGYKSGAIASLNCSLNAHTETAAEISGTLGRIKLPRRWFTPAGIHSQFENEAPSSHTFTVKKNGYEYEAIEVMRCLDLGLTESPLMDLEFTSELIKLLDDLRERAGVRYEWD